MLDARGSSVHREHHRISTSPPPLRTQIRELLRARDLFVLIFGREVRVRYKQTALGLIWVVLQPLVPALIFAAVFGAFARLPSEGSPYLLFALAGLVVYGLFSNAVARSGTSFLRDGNLVTKVYFPRAVLPLAAGTAAIVDFLVGSLVLLVLMVALGQGFAVAIVTAPAIAIAVLSLGLAVGLAVSALTAHYRDFAIAVPFVLQVLLYGSPVLYSSELVPASLQGIYALNPMVGLIESFRSALLGTAPPSSADLAMAAASGVVLVGVCLVVYARASRDLSDVI